MVVCRFETLDSSSLITYGTTKLFNVMIARELQKRLDTDHVLNFVVHPGKPLDSDVSVVPLAKTLAKT